MRSEETEKGLMFFQEVLVLYVEVQVITGLYWVLDEVFGNGRGYSVKRTIKVLLFCEYILVVFNEVPEVHDEVLVVCEEVL